MSNLFGLTDIHFVETDASAIANGIISAYEAAYQVATGERTTLANGDPRRLFLLSIADQIIIQRHLIDYTGKQNLLAYASGDKLDHLGLLVGVERLPSDYARTTMQINLSVAQPGVTLIPAGTRFTSGDGKTYFATSEVLQIPAGDLLGTVSALSEAAGTAANGFLPGQINRLVDPLPYVQSVANITTSEGGADIEDDENLRERIQLAPESYSNAGSKGAYIFWARSASQLIADVGVYSPTPGVVHIYPLLLNGVLPEQEILDRVLEVCSGDTVRPMTDDVRVLAPELAETTLNVEWYLDRSNATALSVITAAVAQAAADWLTWQKSALGRDINPSELTKRMVAAGAKRVEISSPAFQVLAFNQIASFTSTNVVFGGIEDG